MFILIIFIVGLMFLLSPTFRCLFLNLHLYIYNRFKDIYKYFRYLKFHEAKQLNMICFVADTKVSFGSGKTLMMCKFFYNYYKKYNNKKIYIKDENGKYIPKIQKIIAFSNLKIEGIDTISFDSLEMIEKWKDEKEKLEKENPNCIFKLIILSDELGAILNSRSFKSNITNSNINAILQQRHLDVTLWVSSSQRFSFIDALYRNSVDKCVTCKLIGFLDFKKRLLMCQSFLAQEFENCGTEIKIKPLTRKCYFIVDDDYTRYDTKYMIEDLIHKQKIGDLITDEEYLKNIQLDNQSINIKISKNKKKKFLK